MAVQQAASATHSSSIRKPVFLTIELRTSHELPETTLVTNFAAIEWTFFNSFLERSHAKVFLRLTRRGRVISLFEVDFNVAGAFARRGIYWPLHQSIGDLIQTVITNILDEFVHWPAFAELI